MSERTEERTRSGGDWDDRDVDPADLDGVGGSDLGTATGLDDSLHDSLDAGTTADVGRDRTRESATGGRLSGARRRAGSVFSARAFLVSLVATLAGAAIGGSVVPFGSVGALLGIAAVAGSVGVASDSPRYAETAAAGAVAGALGVLLNFVVLSVLTGGLPLAFGGAIGAIGAVIGHYFGRDLRDGLTRDLE